MRFTSEKKTIITIITFTVIAAAIIGIVLIPTFRNIETIDTQIFELRQFLERRYDQALASNNSIEKIKQIQVETDRFPNYLLTRDQQLQFVTLLQTLAATDTVNEKIVSSNVDDTTAANLTFSLSITGNYQNVMHFLRDLEAAPYFVTIETLSLGTTIDPSNPNIPLTTLNLSLHIYVSS